MSTVNNVKMLINPQIVVYISDNCKLIVYNIAKTTLPKAPPNALPVYRIPLLTVENLVPNISPAMLKYRVIIDPPAKPMRTVEIAICSNRSIVAPTVIITFKSSVVLTIPSLSAT